MADLSTKEGWWAEVRRRSNFLEGTFEDSQLYRLIFCDVGCPEGTKVDILIDREMQFGGGVKYLQKALDSRKGMYVEDALKNMISCEDPNLWYIFQSIWTDAPDSFHIHSWTMWGAFCDLCSEGPAVLFPNMEEA